MICYLASVVITKAQYLMTFDMYASNAVTVYGTKYVIMDKEVFVAIHDFWFVSRKCTICTYRI